MNTFGVQIRTPSLSYQTVPRAPTPGYHAGRTGARLTLLERVVAGPTGGFSGMLGDKPRCSPTSQHLHTAFVSAFSCALEQYRYVLLVSLDKRFLRIAHYGIDRRRGP